MSKLNKLLKYIFSALLLLNLNISFSQAVKIDAKFDSTTIKIGDQIKFRFEVEQPQNAKVYIPILENIGDNKEIEILQTFPPDTVKTGNSLKILQEYLVTSFDSGSFVLPSYRVAFENGNLRDTLTTPPLQLTVLSLPTDTVTQVLDIKPPLHTPITLAEIWPYLLGLFILFIVILELIAYSKRSKNKAQGTTFKITEPAHIIALRELDNLRTEKLWQSNHVKQYYVRLTEIIRFYIENRFEIIALEMTTDEVIESFKTVPLDDNNSIVILKNLLTLADLVKFAKHQPLPNENEVSMLNAYQFVNNTKPMFMETKNENEQDKVEQNVESEQVLNKTI